MHSYHYAFSMSQCHNETMWTAFTVFVNVYPWNNFEACEWFWARGVMDEVHSPTWHLKPRVQWLLYMYSSVQINEQKRTMNISWSKLMTSVQCSSHTHAIIPIHLSWASSTPCEVHLSLTSDPWYHIWSGYTHCINLNASLYRVVAPPSPISSSTSHSPAAAHYISSLPLPHLA